MKFCPMGAKLFHADGRTDIQTYMTKLVDVFCNFANAPNNGHIRGLPRYE